MNDMQIFSKPEFGRVGAMTAQDGTPWFNAADVCRVLGYSRTNDAVRLNVDKKDTCKQRTLTSGGKQMVNFVNESGLYSLILCSKKPNAKAFKRWATRSTPYDTLRKRPRPQGDLPKSPTCRGQKTAEITSKNNGNKVKKY